MAQALCLCAFVDLWRFGAVARSLRKPHRQECLCYFWEACIARRKKRMASTLTREQHLELYYFMRLNRELEEQMVRLFRQNKIVGGLYPSLGQEAISVGTAYALAPGDWIAPMIRNIGALLVRGFKPRDVMTQHMARYTSPTQGKDGPSHFGDLRSRHVVAPTSMLGDLIPVMAGIAMAGRYLGQKIVTMTWIGDGGASTGVFHEGLNLAAVQKAPFVLIVENNHWAYSTPTEKQSALRDLADRAKAYGVKSAIVDGNDVLAVEKTTREAVAYARAGNGPVLIEAKTMRMLGHAQHDSAEYVPRALLESWKHRDPLDLFEKVLSEKKCGTPKPKKKLTSASRAKFALTWNLRKILRCLRRKLPRRACIAKAATQLRRTGSGPGKKLCRRVPASRPNGRWERMRPTVRDLPPAPREQRQKQSPQKNLRDRVFE